MSIDGGVRAISGFLFQVLAGGALRAAGECLNYGRSTNPELDALIEVTRVAEVVHEFADEDLVLRRTIIDEVGTTGTEITLLQAKFSLLGAARAISPSEMSEIIKAFAKAKKRIETTGQSVTGYVLITNRSVSETAPSLKGAIETKIHNELRKVTDARIAHWHDALACFARQFGCTDQDIVQGRQALLGRIFETTVTGAASGAITRNDLLECLAGGMTARELTPERQAEAMKRQVAAFDVDVSLQLVQRELLANVDAVCAGRALVIFAGAGGSGKTAALHHWATEIANRSSDSAAGPRPLVAIRAANGLPEDWLSELVHDWNPALRPSSRIDALERLKIANGDAVPTLHLGLDGTDEYPDDVAARGNVHRLARWFWQQDQEALGGKPVRARLVVTCRDTQGFAYDWLSLGRSGGALAPEKTPLTFTFDRFSENELRELLRKNFPALEGRLLPPRLGAEATLVEFAAQSTQTATLHPLAELLRDPVMWRSFCLVTDDDRAQLLRGDETAQMRLAQGYCERFLVKAQSRTGIRSDYLRNALETIADRGRQAGRSFRSITDWQEAAYSGSGLSKPETRKLFDEAASGGVIRIEQRVQWDWRDDIVERFFLTSAEVSLP
jgi:hypothetical protein